MATLEWVVEGEELLLEKIGQAICATRKEDSSTETKAETAENPTVFSLS